MWPVLLVSMLAFVASYAPYQPCFFGAREKALPARISSPHSTFATFHPPFADIIKYKWSLNIYAPHKPMEAPSEGPNEGIEVGEQIDLLFDGDCPICMMEVNFLKKRDVKGLIKFSNLRDPGYDPADHGDVSFELGMRKLRAVLPDGQVVVGMEVFRRTYSAIGLGWIFELTNLPVVGGLADALYDFWAENRLRWTGRGDLADILIARANEIKELEYAENCEDECGIDWDAMP